MPQLPAWEMPVADAMGQGMQRLWGWVLTATPVPGVHPAPTALGLQPLHRAHTGKAQPKPGGRSSPRDPKSHRLSTGMPMLISRLHMKTHVPIAR